MSKKSLIQWAAFTVLSAVATVASADTIASTTCSGAATARVFTLSGVDQCLMTGNGGGTNLNSVSPGAIIAAGWTFADSTNDGQGPNEGWISAAVSGTYSQNGAEYGTYTVSTAAYTSDLILGVAIRSTPGAVDPGWAFFLLTPQTTGSTWTWTLTPETSNFNYNDMALYSCVKGAASECGGGGPIVVPEPGSLALLGLGLLGAGIARRRRG